MKRLVFYILYVSGIARISAWLNRRRVMILCYHGVTERAARDPKDVWGLHVRQDRFVQQLEFLNRNYRVLSLREYVDLRRSGKPLPDYSVVLTFDDGYRNFLSAAAPRLLAAKIPACTFVITDRVSETNSKSHDWSDGDDETYLSWPEILELKENGFDFGSHTCSHPELPRLSENRVSEELSRSRQQLVRKLEMDGVSLAYPFGLFDDHVASQTEAAGYACAVTTDAGFNDSKTDLYKLKRTLIGDDDDIPAFATRVSGLTRWLSRFAS